MSDMFKSKLTDMQVQYIDDNNMFKCKLADKQVQYIDDNNIFKDVLKILPLSTFAREMNELKRAQAFRQIMI